MTIIHCIALDQLNKENFPSWLATLSPTDQERILNFKDFKAAKRSLLGQVLANYLLVKKTRLPIDKIKICRNDYGKPLVVSPRNLYFNISHAGAWVVCALADKPIGIDIEEIVPLDLTLARRFFAPSEIDILQAKEGVAASEYFYQIWTLKESYLKALGKGLSLDLKSFSFQLNKRIVLLKNGRAGGYSFWQGKIDPRHIWSLCTGEDNKKPRLKFISLAEIRAADLVK